MMGSLMQLMRESVATEKRKIVDRLMLEFRQSKSIWNFSVTSASGTAMETNPMFIEKSLETKLSEA